MVNLKFPDKKYNIIYADPPWDVTRGADFNSNGKSISKYIPKILNGKSRKLTYPTMSLNEIKELPIRDISSNNCKLFIWTINKYLPDVFDVIKSWGFKYSTTLLWNKKPMGIGLGGTFTTNTEYLIFAYKGKQNAIKKYDRCWFEQPRGVHSKKPDFFRNLISDTYSKDESKIELFARQKYHGWDVWGDEVVVNVNNGI